MSLLLLLSTLEETTSTVVSAKISYHLIFYGAIQFDALEQDPELIIAEVF